LNQKHMTARYLLIAIFMAFCGICSAQQFQLTKQQKKELKALQKEGWQTLNPAEDLAERYTIWCQKEAEVRKDGYYRYSVDYSEVEDANLQIAERRAWNDVCTVVRGKKAMKVANAIKTKESTDGNGNEQSEIAYSQRTETNYSGTMKDIEKIFAIYKKTPKGYLVKIVAAKEN